MKFFKRVSLALKSPDEVNRQNPSVNSYDSMSELLEALRIPDALPHATDEQQSQQKASRRSSTSSQVSSTSSSQDRKNKKKQKDPVGWKLATHDKDSSEPQTMEEECNRLRVLQSYFVLDSEGEEEFDRITNFAASLFGMPMAIISLVDLGRQWFLSKVGLDAAETSRDVAFCAHVVISKLNVLVVPNALEDFRFKNNPLVTGGPMVRFYAGAALISPEGYKLGTLCLIDTKPRTFSESDQIRLVDLAKMVMSSLVARRNRLLLAQSKELLETTGESFVSTINTLSKAAQDIELAVTQGDKNLPAVVHELRLQEKICKVTARELLEKEEDLGKEKKAASTGWADGALSSYDDFLLSDGPTTDVQKLYDNLNRVVKLLHGAAIVTVEVEAGVPHTVSGDELLLFRSVLNLLMHGINRSGRGSVHLRISCRNPAYLLFECEDSGRLIPENKVAAKWKKERVLLLPIRSLTRSVGGSFGTGRGRLDRMEAPPNAIFWFKTSNDVDFAEHEKFSANIKTSHQLCQLRSSKGLKDPFAAALLEEGCINMDLLNQSSSSGSLSS